MNRWLRALTVTACIALSGAWPSVAQAGELDHVRKQVRTASAPRPAPRPAPSSARPPSRPPPTSRAPYGRTIDPGYPNRQAVTYVHPCCRRTSGFAVLPTPVSPTVGRYLRHPYEKDADGFVVREPRDEVNPRGRLWSAQINAEAAYLGKSLWKAGFGLDLDYWRVGIGSDLDWVVQGALQDAMYLGSTNARVTLIMRPRLRLRLGGGAQYMVDGRTPGQGHREYASGPNATADLDLFPFRPLTVSARLDYGTLYRAPSMLAQLTAGVTLRGVQVYGGYEARRIGEVTLQGPVGGVRLWF